MHEPVAVEPAPTSCPFCRSPRIATTTEKVDASSYWRCTACGEMWNVERLRSSHQRFDPTRPWR
jgi:transposase-like protein